MHRIFTTLLLITLTTLLAAFMFANRGDVLISFDPVNMEQPALFWEGPLFWTLAGAVFIGFILGAIGMWISTTRLRQRVGDTKRRVRELEHELKLARARGPVEPGGINLPAIRS
ncbi:MAG: LapA family protein [Pseudomonadota bacterium]